MITSFRRFSALLFSSSLAFAVGSVAEAGTFKHITIDGNFADWAGVPIAYSDPSEEGADAGTDFKDVWIAHDADFVYVRVSLYNTGTLARPQNNVFVNGDGDSTTGYGIRSTGSEMLIQGGSGYQEKNGGFNDGFGILDLGWSLAPSVAAGEFEFRISRAAKYEDGGSVFTSDAIGLLLETESQNYTAVDTAKDDSPIEYTLDAAPPAATGDFNLLSLSGTDWRYNRTGTDLGTDWREIAYDDSGWETGRALFGKTPNPNLYPASIATPLTDNHRTHYFRAKFPWDKDTARLSLILSNYLSDGAVIYLNGAEVSRVRLTTNAVSFATPALGQNPAPGAVEIIDLPANALIAGDNVLAVEVHQNENDNIDLVFGLALFASDRLPVSIAAPLSAQTVSVEEGTPLTLSVQVRGAEPITYQWFKGGTAIADATQATFTIPAVGPADAGEYVVKVGNAGANNVTSPIFKVETRAIPVTITDPAQPANLAVTEGNSATFTVAVAGSEPIQFQWFKDGVSIAGATNRAYVLPAVLPEHAGQYTCVISNRVTAPITSRAATLTVNSDKTGPALVSVTGGGNRVSLQFSEPIDPASVAPARFTLSPARIISAANADTNDASRVVLTITPLTLGALYSVAISDLKDVFGNSIAAGATRQFRATIVLDGDFSDWEGVPVALSDPEDAGLDTGAQVDFKDIWITSDNNYVYLRFSLWRTGEPFTSFNNIFVDADNDPTTGYLSSGAGSDMLIQSGSGYEEKSGVFNDGGVENLDWLAAANEAGTEFEVRFSRAATYADADAGGLVFKSDTIGVVLESETTGYVAKEYAPDSGSGAITHTLINYAVTELGSLSASRSASGLTITWTGAGKLQSTGALSSGTWQDVPNAASPYSTTAAGTQRFYRLTTP